MQLVNKKLPIYFILAIWTLILTILGLLQLGGFSFGFKLVPHGEDLNWLSFINQSPYVGQIAHRFWSVDCRNPLSPWFWILVAHIVTKYTWGLYAVRCLMDPILATIMYGLLLRLSKHQSQMFAFSVAVITLMWNFFILYEQLIWVFECALAFGLLSIFFYCRYVDNLRAQGSDFALALLCYFIAISTYTLISGSIIAIGFISLFREDGSPYSLKQRLFATARDTSFFLALFILFYLIWYTASIWVDMVVKTDVIFHWNQLIKSIIYLYLIRITSLFCKK
ncbi:MAG: hypothetical protein H0U73_09440 [Tatlockia sp.]|nr:hypothetical protein [Tatlockia sp.]